jgi:hypothetical protein
MRREVRTNDTEQNSRLLHREHVHRRSRKRQCYCSAANAELARSSTAERGPMTAGPDHVCAKETSCTLNPLYWIRRERRKGATDGQFLRIHAVPRVNAIDYRASNSEEGLRVRRRSRREGVHSGFLPYVVFSQKLILEGKLIHETSRVLRRHVGHIAECYTFMLQHLFKIAVIWRD